MFWRQIDIDDQLFTYEYFTQEDVCRLCWSKDANINIFSNNTEIHYTIILDVLVNNLQVKVEPTHSKNLCNNCFNEIERIYDFKTFCQKTSNKLENILQNGLLTNVKSENESSNSEESDDNSVLDDYFNPSDSGIEIKKEKLFKNVSQRKRISRLTFCRICKIDFIDLIDLSDHNTKYHGIENNGTLYKCFGCEKTYRTKKLRNGHETTFCKGLENGFKCDICDRYIQKRRAFELHMRDHRLNIKTELPEELFKCDKCKKCFKSMKLMRNHVQEVHDKKTYVCEECGKVFNRQDYLHKHRLMHAGIKRHQCPHCDYKAIQKSSLNLHLRKHTGVRPYTCDICSQQCVSSSNLRAHRERHMGDKHYQCNICSKKFGYKISLEEHISSTHVRSESHSCEHCGSTFTRLRGLKRHLAAKHRKLNATNENMKEITKNDITFDFQPSS